MKKETQKCIFFTLIIVLVTCSCYSDTKENIHPTIINKENNELVNLEIRLPFESSNNIYEDEINFELFDHEGKIIKSEFDTVTKTGGHIIYLLSITRLLSFFNLFRVQR